MTIFETHFDGRSEMIKNGNLYSNLIISLTIKFSTLIQDSSSNCLISGCQQLQSVPQTPTMYFMKGNDERLLSFSQAKEIEEFIASTKPQTSCFVYNSTEAMRKYQNWNTNLPWIKVHYAIKSNPALPLLRDLHAKNTGFDCASR